MSGSQSSSQSGSQSGSQPGSQPESLPNYYELLGVTAQASAQRLRQAHRDLSKLYHPDTTRFPAAAARQKFEQIQAAYEILSDPVRRLQYDLQLGWVSPPKSMISPPPPRSQSSHSAYLSAEDRPLSPGELSVLLMFGVTFLGCLLLAIALGLARGEDWMPTPSWQSSGALGYLEHCYLGKLGGGNGLRLLRIAVEPGLTMGG
ncbi:MAG: J domain-containing protein [Synechococcales cyanobacterium RM1_1_8]|nr:J domain-containing protein [Synechococcales cyanobacterium RM1_1_8]